MCVCVGGCEWVISEKRARACIRVCVFVCVRACACA